MTSLILLASTAAVPVSSFIAGALISVSLSGLLLGAGLLMTITTLLFAATKAARELGLMPVVTRT